RLFGEQLVNGLVLPEGVISRMLDELVPEAELIQSAAATQFPGRGRLHPHVVLVVVAAPPLDVPLARGELIVNPAHIELAEGPVVEPVVPHPAIDHRIHWHRPLEGWVGIDQRHQGKEAVVRDPRMPTLPLVSGTFLTSQSMVSKVSVA